MAAEQIAAADGGPFIGFPSIMPSRPPLLSFGVRTRRARVLRPREAGYVERLSCNLVVADVWALATHLADLRDNAAIPMLNLQ
jgi:hypothetical protein